MQKRMSGIRLPHRKGTQQSQRQTLPLPKLVRIPMSMHIGAPCEPLVKLRDSVTVGQKIGDSNAYVSAPIHSGVSGTVTGISQYRMSSGTVCPMVEITTDGLQTVCPSVKPPTIGNREEFLTAIRESGLTGMGGAGFPAHVKLSPKQPVDTLLINAAECEPYITSDCRQMVEAPQEVVDGILQVLHFLEIPKAILGIESNKPQAIAALRRQLEGQTDISLQVLPETYPQGAEKVFIYHTLGRIVAEGQLPADQGVIVMNVSSVAFLSRYLKTGMPMVERTLTVDGDAVASPCNVTVPIGTPVQEVLEFAHWDPQAAGELLYGGPMMGISIPDPSSPVLKSNNAILAFRAPIKIPEPSACIRCGSCLRACPLRLMPTEIEKAYRRGDREALQKLQVTLCMNCGSCSYVCPAKRRVAQTNQLAKTLLAQKQ